MGIGWRSLTVDCMSPKEIYGYLIKRATPGSFFAGLLMQAMLTMLDS